MPGRISVNLPRPNEESNAEIPVSDVRSLPASRHTLELRFRQPTNLPLVARLRFTPPQLVAATGLSELYWQIILPSDRHIVVEPQMTACFEWRWSGGILGRQPQKTQAQLEQWTAATEGRMPAGQNEYLFNSLAAAGTIEMIVAPRWLIVFSASAAVLLFALVGIYAPAIRRRSFIVTLILALVVLTIAFPTVAVLIGQASLLGITCALTAAWIAHFAARVPRTASSTVSLATHRSTSPRANVLPPSSVVSAVPSPSSVTMLHVGDQKI
jgi:hypothetical protein